MLFDIKYCLVSFFFLGSLIVNAQQDTVKVLGTLFVKKMVDAAAQQGAKDQVLVADSAGYLYFKDSGINYPVPVELDSISMLDSLDHKTGLIAVVKNNGSFVSDGTRWIRMNCNLTLSNVKQLRNLKKQDCPVFVQSYYDSLHYGGGYFHWVGYDQLGNGDDGGNVFSAVDTGFWVRDKIVFIPSNYGAVDSSDQRFSDFKTSSDALQRCINSAGKYGSIELDHGFVYLNAGTIMLLEGQILDGRNATLYRIDRAVSTVTSHQTGSNIVHVADPDMFEKGMNVAFKSNDQYTYSYKITEIEGSKLTLNAGVGFLNGSQASCSGAKIFSSCYQISAVEPNIKIDNLILNGNNWHNYEDNRWEISGEMYTASFNGKFTNITVQNSPGESINLFATNTLLRNIAISNGFGNGIHLGGNERYTIDNVVINTVNMLATSGDFTLGHEGGGIAHSDSVHGGLIHNVYVENALAVVAGINGDDDSDNRYDKLIGVNCKQAIEIKQPAGGSGLSNISITNSKFTNCVALTISSNNSAQRSEMLNNIRIRNVELANTSLIVSNVDSLFGDAIFFISSSADYYLKFNNVSNTSFSGLKVNGGKHIYISNCDNLEFSNFGISNTLGNCAIQANYSVGSLILNSGFITHDNAPNGYRGIYVGAKTMADNINIVLKGQPNSGIELYNSSSDRGAIIKNCNIKTPQNVPTIKGFYGTTNNYLINNIINQPIQDNGDNVQIGTIFIPE